MADETITLQNVAVPRGPVTLHLGHTEVCANHGVCHCQRMPVGVSKVDSKGERVVELETRQVPSSITLWAKGSEGDAITGLPVAVLHALDVKRHLRAKTIKATRVPVPAPGPVATPVVVDDAPECTTTPAAAEAGEEQAQ